MLSQARRSWWGWAVGLAIVVMALGVWALLARPSAVADEGSGDSVPREETQADVVIKNDSFSQGRGWWPDNSKLLITAKHGLLAIGTPTFRTAIYTWEDHLGVQTRFKPNNTPRDPTKAGHWTMFTATDAFTPPADKNNQKIKVQYKLYNEPIDQEPLNLTRPASATAAPMQISEPGEWTGPWRTGIIGIINKVVRYTVADQFGDSIKDSDPGDKHWIICEDVPWQSPITKVQEYCETEIDTDEDWHIPDNEADGYFDDKLRILALPAIFLYNQAQEGMNLITVNPHDWYVGVGSEGNLSGGEEQIAGNHFVVHITEYSQGPTNITIKFTVSYQVTLK